MKFLKWTGILFCLSVVAASLKVNAADTFMNYVGFDLLTFQNTAYLGQLEKKEYEPEVIDVIGTYMNRDIAYNIKAITGQAAGTETGFKTIPVNGRTTVYPGESEGPNTAAASFEGFKSLNMRTKNLHFDKTKFSGSWWTSKKQFESR